MYRVFSFSEAGTDQETNEDILEIQKHPGMQGCWLCTLADGQGGQAGGRRAAQAACTSAIKAAIGLAPEKLASQSAWTTILRTADKAVAADPGAGYTTLVGICLVGNELYGASNGDSSVLAVDAEGCKELTSNQMKNPLVGSECAVCVPFATKLVNPWLVMMMSDGVLKYVGWERVRDNARRLRGQALLDCLQEQARLRGSKRFQDDFSVVLLEKD
jgi:serine/threonine protein phosphatase PrpC